MSFLTSDVIPQNFRQKQFYQRHQEALKQIHNGENLWKSESDQIKGFRTYVQENWLPIPTNTQLVERWVKDSNECTFTSKDENFADAVAILRSTTVFRFRQKALRLYEGRILCANQHRSAGKVGSRINKNTGELEETKNIEKVRGAFYNNLVVKHVVLESKALERLVTENVRQQLLARIKNLHMCFQTVRTNATLTSYTRTMHSQTPMPNNATVNETGFKVTDHMRGRFPYGKLQKVHLLLVQAEIRHRGGEVDPKMKIRKLGQYLKTLDIENQRKTYKERTGVDARDEDLNTTTFKPCCGTTEYNALLRKD